jgi:hypothetical protein
LISQTGDSAALSLNLWSAGILPACALRKKLAGVFQGCDEPVVAATGAGHCATCVTRSGW